MSEDKVEIAAPARMPLNMEEFAAMLGQAVAEGIAKSSPKKETFGQYIKRVNKGRSVLRRESFQNGYHIDAGVLSNDEIDLLNRITHSGRYINRMVEVLVREDGVDEVVEIRYNSKKDAALELSRHIRGFADLLQQVVDAQTEERKAADQREEKTQARRKFGDNQGYRDAKAKADAAV